MSKEEMKNHIIGLIDSMAEITEFSITGDPIETTTASDVKRTFISYNVIEIKVIGRRLK